jgi:hypothetical protein
MSDLLRTFVALIQEQEFPLNRKLFGPQDRTGWAGQKKSLLTFQGIKHDTSVFERLA